jgi:hypothetical protein
MKVLVTRYFIGLAFCAAAAVAFGSPFKSKIITGTDSTLVITVPDGHFLKITNFSQDGGTDRGAVHVTLNDSENGGTTKVLVATRIDLSTGINSVNVPEIGNRAIITGPATVRVPPIVGATLFITYRKEPNDNEGGGGGGVTPIPIFISPTPGVTPTPTATASPTATVSPTP